MSSLQDDARRYHSEGRPGKIEIALTKPCATQRDLSLAQFRKALRVRSLADTY